MAVPWPPRFGNSNASFLRPGCHTHIGDAQASKVWQSPTSLRELFALVTDGVCQSPKPLDRQHFFEYTATSLVELSDV